MAIFGMRGVEDYKPVLEITTDYPETLKMFDYNAVLDILEEQYKKSKTSALFIDWFHTTGKKWFIKEYIGESVKPRVKDNRGRGTGTSNTNIYTSGNDDVDLETDSETIIQKKDIKKLVKKNNFILIGGIITGALILTGIVLVVVKHKKSIKSVQIKKIKS